MKKLILSALMASAFISSSAFADTSFNAGKITFKGQVIDGACSIAPGDDDQTITLSAVRASTFKTANQLANAKKPFSIELRDCDPAIFEHVNVTFTGISDATVPGLLANNAGAGGAANIGLQLFDKNGKAITLGTAENATHDLLAGTNKLDYSVDYMSTTATVTSGPVLATTDFQLNYN